MEMSRKAVEAYRRTRLIDQVTTDDDNITPAYRLDDISDVIRSSSIDMILEMLEYTFKRLRNKSPRVKQKTLRFVKYTVGKAGPEYKRELQRQSAAIRELFHFRGQVDPLRGDALNKAVRDTAHEAIAAIFASDGRPPTVKETSKRIQGFGSSNFEMPAEGNKSLLNEVVDFGSSSVKQGQGLSTINGHTSTGNAGIKSSTSGHYRGPSLRMSLTSEREMLERQDVQDFEESQVSIEVPDLRVGGSAYESQLPGAEVNNGSSNLYNGRESVHEERLLDMITAPGGVRLQPTRESLQSFLSNALKLDPVNLSRALENKIQSYSWQVRLKALCVLEAILRQKDESFFETVAALFEGDGRAVQECLQSPQTSLREKAKKVLYLLGDLSKEDNSGNAPVASVNDVPTFINMPDLIDTREPDLPGETDAIAGISPSPTGNGISRTPITEPLASLGSLGLNTAQIILDTALDDPFAGMSLHALEDSVGDLAEDLLSSLLIDDRGSANYGPVGGLSKEESNMFESLGAGEAQTRPSTSLESLVGAISTNSSTINGPIKSGSSGNLPGFPKLSSIDAPLQGNTFPVQTIGSLPNPQMVYLNPSLMLPGGMVGAFHSNMMMPQAFASGALHFGGVGNFLAQQQLLAGITGLQRFGLGAHIGNVGGNQGNVVPGRGLGDSYHDGFDFSSNATSEYISTAESVKEETKAFDFISDHLCSAWSLKKAT